MQTVGGIEVPGFPRCAECQIVQTAQPWMCAQCTSTTLPPLPTMRCPICQQRVGASGQCANALCTDPDRQFRRVSAIAAMTDVWERTIKRYKYDGKHGWAQLFARLVVAHVDRIHDHDTVGLVIANPTYGTTDRPLWTSPLSHTELVIHYARVYDAARSYTYAGRRSSRRYAHRWPWDDASDPALVKTGPTPASAGQGLAHRRAVAAQLRGLLDVRHPERIVGAQVLVYDDVFTSGSTINEVARVLRDAGADTVEGVVLARQLWT